MSINGLIPRLFRSVGPTGTNTAETTITKQGQIIEFRRVKGLGQIVIKELTDYISFDLLINPFTVTRLISSQITSSNITSSVGEFTYLSGTNVSGSQATFTQLTGSATLTTFFTSSYAKVTQITGSHQKLIDGTNAFVAGHGISIQNHFGGAVGISSSMIITPVKTSTYTAVVGDVILADISAGGFTINLPDATVASNKNGEIIIKIHDTASGNTLTIDGNGSQTIDGSTTKTLTTDYASMWLKCDGANWWKLV